MIAALFVDTDGVYFNLEGIDPWDVYRDARKYEGPYPVIAHPPCQLWTNLACVNYKRWGGEHNRPGNDGGCFESALHSVRTYGGVLEHPAYSRAFKTYKLPIPVGVGWRQTNEFEWVCGVNQSIYGHKAKKYTWLYYWGQRPKELDWRVLSGTHQIGRFDQIKPVLSKREANATPLRFRDALIELVTQ